MIVKLIYIQRSFVRNKPLLTPKRMFLMAADWKISLKATIAYVKQNDNFKSVMIKITQFALFWHNSLVKDGSKKWLLTNKKRCVRKILFLISLKKGTKKADARGGSVGFKGNE